MNGPTQLTSAGLSRDYPLQWACLKLPLASMGVLTVVLLIVLRLIPALRISSFLLLVASASFLLVGYSKDADLLHPVRIFGALWCFCLALGSMRLLSLISEWGPMMWACVLTGLATFVGGFAWGYYSYVTRATRSDFRTIQAALVEHLVPERRALLAAGLCMVIGTSVLAYEFYLLGEIPILSENQDALRMELFGASANPKFDNFALKVGHFFVEFTKYGVFLASIVLFQRKPKSKATIINCWLLILGGTLIYGSQAGRTFILTIAIGGVVLFHYLRRPIRLASIAISVSAALLFVGLFGSMRVKQTKTAPIFDKAFGYSDFPEGELWQGVAFAYATATISMEVFYRFTEDLKALQHPQAGYLFYSLHRFIPRSSLGEVATNLYSTESTTSTFLGDFYGDYGYWGVFFGPLITGFFYGWAYSHRSGPMLLYWIYVRALLLHILIFFAYVNLFSIYLTWAFDLIAMHYILRLVTARWSSSPA